MSNLDCIFFPREMQIGLRINEATIEAAEEEEEALLRFT